VGRKNAPFIFAIILSNSVKLCFVSPRFKFGHILRHCHIARVISLRIIKINPPLATARSALCIGAVHLFVCLFVCLSVAKMQKKHDFLKKEAIWSYDVYCRPIGSYIIGLFKEPIIGSLKSKMAEISHLENRYDVIFFCRRWSDG